MKTSAFKLPVVACLALTAGGLLTSCIDPYYADGNGPGYRGGSYGNIYSPGYQVRTLPPGYRTERYGDRDYYQYGGHYYQRHSSGGYIIVEAPRRGPSYHQSQFMPRLPSGYRTLKGRDGNYYRAGNSYYKRQGNGYIVIEHPL